VTRAKELRLGLIQPLNIFWSQVKLSHQSLKVADLDDLAFLERRSNKSDDGLIKLLQFNNLDLMVKRMSINLRVTQ
jgi:hypothetical protein